MPTSMIFYTPNSSTPDSFKVVIVIQIYESIFFKGTMVKKKSSSGITLERGSCCRRTSLEAGAWKMLGLNTEGRNLNQQEPSTFPQHMIFQVSCF